MLAAELNNLGAPSRNPSAPSQPPLVEDDSEEEEEGASAAHDGTLLASEPPRPLYVGSQSLTRFLFALMS